MNSAHLDILLFIWFTAFDIPCHTILWDVCLHPTEGMWAYSEAAIVSIIFCSLDMAWFLIQVQNGFSSFIIHQAKFSKPDPLEKF